MNILNPYLPADRRYALAHQQTLPDRTIGTVLFADVSGFTPLTAALAKGLGPQRGAEEMTRHLNRVCGALIAEVDRYRGSVISFSGDAITCWFDEKDETGRSSTEKGTIQPSAFRAAAAALAMQTAIQALDPVKTPLDTEVQFAIKVSLAGGSVRRFLVGHPEHRVIEVLAGTILDRMATAEHLAQKGEIVVAAEVAAALGDKVIIQEWRPSPTHQPFAIITGLQEAIPPQPWPEQPVLNQEITRQWLLPPVYQRLQRGEAGFLAELRQAVALFQKFSDLNYDEDDEAGAKLNAYICWVQTVLNRYGGHLLQLSIDDKGSYLYGVFGALQAHEDDPARAVAAALELHNPPAELSFINQMQIGISRGQVYAGGYGGPTRQTYGVLGNQVNIAARLMMKAQLGQTLVTSFIMQATIREYDYAELGAVPLKGLTNPQLIFTLSGRRRKVEAGTLKGRTLAPMVGREEQRAVLLNQLQALYEQAQSSCLVIEGEAGIGKSRLVIELVEQARTLGLVSLLGTGDAIENAAAYHAWRPLFRQVFGLDAPSEEMKTAPIEEWRANVLHQLQDLPTHFVPLIPLLNVVLPLDLPENEFTAQLSGEVRANNTLDLLVGLLQTRAQSQPLLIVLDDAQWFDSASWVLTRMISRTLQPLLLVIVTRPLENPQPGEYTALLELPSTHHLRLDIMSAADIENLICQRLQVKELPPRVANLIHEKAAGHPFFSEELAYALRDGGLIQIVGDECQVTPKAGALRAMDFPDTIQGVITSRIDRLSPQHQLTLKVASVIGRVFWLNALTYIYPLETDKPVLPTYLGALEQASITTAVAGDPDLSYLFKHVITQEVAYGLLLYAQRQSLHRGVAEWYEQAYDKDLSGSYPLLAYHWRNAGDLANAVNYLEKAAEEALRNNANQEAIRFLNEALTLYNQIEGSPSSLRLARWQRQLGEAHMRVGLMQDGQAHYEQTLVLAGYPAPVTSGQISLRMVRQIGRQMGHRLRPQWFLHPAEGEQAAIVTEAARAYQELVLIYYLNNNLPAFLHAILAALNLAEKANSPRELAEGYATMCLVAGAVPQLNLAPVYEPRAMAAAERLNSSSIWGFVLLRIGTFKATVGLWAGAHEATEQAIRHYEHINDPRGVGDAVNVLGILSELEGNFAAALRAFTDLHTLARKHDNVQHEGWGLGGQAAALLLLGRTEEALAKAQMALERPEVGGVQEINNTAVVALAQLRLGKVQAGVAAADKALALMRGVTPTAFMVIAHLQLATVYLTAWEAAAPDSSLDRKVLATGTKQTIKVLHRFNIGKPAAWLCQGWQEQVQGKPGKAMKLWQKGVAAAVELQTPFEEGWLHYQIARHLPPTDPARATHLAQARAIFTRLDTAHELSLVALV